MEFFEVIKKRKAVRKFIPQKKIQKEDVDKILKAVDLAPSAKNLQSYKLFIVQSENIIGEVSQACYSQKADFIRNAALILIFCTDPKSATEYFGERGEKLYSLQDATIAGTYAILAATDLGYSSCWVGNFDDGNMQRVLRTRLKPVAAIIIGYSNEDPQRPPRKQLDILAKFI